MKNLLIVIAFFILSTSPKSSFSQSVLDNLKLTEQVQIYFESGQFNLTDYANRQLQKVAEKCKNNALLRLRITAHTDGQGAPQSNYILADKRANAVKYFLISKNIKPDVIVASTFGQDKPLADNSTETGRKQNRRAIVEIYEPAEENVRIIEKQVIVEKPIIQTQTVEKIVEIQAKPTEKAEITEESKPFLQGFVRNSETKATAQATVFVKRANGKVDSMTTESNGSFKFLCTFDELVTIDVFAKGYFYTSIDAVVARNNAQKIEVQPMQIGSIAAINNLYFVGDEATLLKTSDPELAKILRFMQLNKGIKIEIAGHVNAPGIDPEKLPKDEFDLSVSRADAIRLFLIQNGFSSEKITAKGYGNSQMRYPEPTNEHQEELNRRVEIKILDIN